MLMQDEMLIVLGDTIIDFDLEALKAQKHSWVAVKKVDDPRHFGVVAVNDEGFVEKLFQANHTQIKPYTYRNLLILKMQANFLMHLII